MSISWQLTTWLLALLCHVSSRHWPYRIKDTYFSPGKDFNDLCNLNVEKLFSLLTPPENVLSTVSDAFSNAKFRQNDANSISGYMHASTKTDTCYRSYTASCLVRPILSKPLAARLHRKAAAAQCQSHLASPVYCPSAFDGWPNHSTQDSSIVKSKFHFVLIWNWIEWLLYIFAHATTAVLSWHVQKCIAI